MQDVNDVNQITATESETPESDIPESDQSNSEEVESTEPEAPSSYSAEEYQTLQNQLKEKESEWRKQRRGITRELNTLKRQLKTSDVGQEDQGDQSNDEVTTLRHQLAVTQLKTGVRDLVDKYGDQMSPALKKAILRNPRGFVSEDAQNVQDGLEDIEDYILDMAENAEPQAPSKKQVQVAGNNKPSAKSEISNSARVNEILAKPVDDWTEEDLKIIDDFKASQT